MLPDHSLLLKDLLTWIPEHTILTWSSPTTPAAPSPSPFVVPVEPERDREGGGSSSCVLIQDAVND